ncbi:MAG: hypothetical protein SF187_15485 [Deltaproteobacteria bacterium]|nr:hypothetical protein [Deltaproteobacteria bacterium]
MSKNTTGDDVATTNRRTFVRAAAWSALGVVTLAGCRTGQPVLVDFGDRSRHFLPSDYPAIFNRWTRHARFVSANEGTVIEMWGTLKSWEFREAYVERYAETYALSGDEKSALMASELKKSRAVYEFHLTVQTSDYRSNDLEKRDSAWRLSLVDGTGDELFPSEVEFLRLPIPYEETFFPEKTSFSRAYTATFEHEKPDQGSAFGGAATGELTLRVRGPLGGVELTWQSK